MGVFDAGQMGFHVDLRECLGPGGQFQMAAQTGRSGPVFGHFGHQILLGIDMRGQRVVAVLALHGGVRAFLMHCPDIRMAFRAGIGRPVLQGFGHLLLDIVRPVKSVFLEGGGDEECAHDEKEEHGPKNQEGGPKVMLAVTRHGRRSVSNSQRRNPLRLAGRPGFSSSCSPSQSQRRNPAEGLRETGRGASGNASALSNHPNQSRIRLTRLMREDMVQNTIAGRSQESL